LGWFLSRSTRRAVRRNQPIESTVNPSLAAAALILYVLTASFAAVDWIASLEPHWYSSIFSLYIVLGQGLSALLTVLALLLYTQRDRPGDDSARPTPLQDLATLLFAMIVLHAYLAYSQFFIIWNANLPHEISWFLPRTRGLWGAVAILLILFHPLSFCGALCHPPLPRGAPRLPLAPADHPHRHDRPIPRCPLDRSSLLFR
jgi:hypothetical protein